MCGIAGLWELEEAGHETQPLDAAVRAMASRLVHRGPDDGDHWIDAGAGIALGHRRLAILDLSPEGRQPMHSSCGRLVMVFNGEIYNYRELGRELAAHGISFRGSSDTEVALAAIARWGFDDAIARFNGMFAIAVWDRGEHRLSLARDRIGIKPLYFGWVGRRFVFASELKAIATLSSFDREIDPNGIAEFFRFGYVRPPLSIYRGIRALQPATIAHVDCESLVQREPVSIRYWKPPSGSDRVEMTADEAAVELETLLSSSVRLRMAADVPLGAFLSGGIDSSLIVALLQKESRRPIQTFTIGFHEDGYDEAPYAAAISRHLGTEHTEVYVTAQEAMEVVPRLAEIWDEPFADSSQIPTYLISKVARSAVTVALSGDGGDELFGGYTRYPEISREWQRSRVFPSPVRKTLAKVSNWTARSAPESLVGAAVPIFRLLGKPTSNIRERFRWRAHAWEQDDFVEFYFRHASFAVNPHVEALLGSEPARLRSPCDLQKIEQGDVIEIMMALDLHQYLPDDILTKVDRASMAVGLEARVPLLDHRVVEFAWRLPFDVRYGAHNAKELLRGVLRRHVPENLFDRPKKGFGIPYGEWIRGPLREWAEPLLSPTGLEESGRFNVPWIQNRWQEHLHGEYDHRNLLWPILIFEDWRRRWKAR